MSSDPYYLRFSYLRRPPALPYYSPKQISFNANSEHMLRRALLLSQVSVVLSPYHDFRKQLVVHPLACNLF